MTVNLLLVDDEAQPDALRTPVDMPLNVLLGKATQNASRCDNASRWNISAASIYGAQVRFARRGTAKYFQPSYGSQ